MPINLYKIEIIASLRLDDKPRAVELLNTYINTLDALDYSNIKSPGYWETARIFASSERQWASQMLAKLSGM